MKKELLIGLSEEQIAKAKACGNSEELLKLAKVEGIELTKEQLEAISGGGGFCESTPTFHCPECNSTDVNAVSQSGAIRNYWSITCKKCGHHWMVS